MDSLFNVKTKDAVILTTWADLNDLLYTYLDGKCHSLYVYTLRYVSGTALLRIIFTHGYWQWVLLLVPWSFLSGGPANDWADIGGHHAFVFGPLCDNLDLLIEKIIFFIPNPVFTTMPVGESQIGSYKVTDFGLVKVIVLGLAESPESHDNQSVTIQFVTDSGIYKDLLLLLNFIKKNKVASK